MSGTLFVWAQFTKGSRAMLDWLQRVRQGYNIRYIELHLWDGCEVVPPELSETFASVSVNVLSAQHAHNYGMEYLQPAIHIF